jgi:serine/threonine protein kinase
MTAVRTPPRFQILRRLGEGGMGIVYEALDRERGVNVALKKLKSFSAEGLVRFKTEFRALQDLHHRNLVLLGELISEGDDWFFTMELVDGCDFLQYVRGGVPFAGGKSATGDDTLVDHPDDAMTLPSEPRPAGPDLRTDVRAGPAFDERLLRDGLRQLADGLCALHDARLVHRDVKPSNIRVTPEGRVVLLDFGLIEQLGDDRTSGRFRDAQPADLDDGEIRVEGTPRYMAPEQVTTPEVEASADWYSVGVVLYEALTGSVPFRGNAVQILERKLIAEPPPPSAVAPEVPQDLEALCLALLRRDPRARPTGADVLRVLGGGPLRRGGGADTQASRSLDMPFVGRAEELDALSLAFRRSHEECAVSVVVRGDSGIGKSALVRQFVRQAQRQAPDTIVLRGRCYERESVPYKAFDGVVDALARELGRRAEQEIAELLPTDLAALAQVFPVLRSVAVVEPLSRSPSRVLDPIELRARAFAALQELLRRMASQAPIVVVIDDVQWADEDSRALAADLLGPPHAPTVLLLVTVRPTHEASAEPGGRVKFVEALPGDVRTIDLQGLAPGEARELAATLIRRAGQAGFADAGSIARESEGHPLLIDALIRHGWAEHRSTERAVRLEEALWSRIEPLDEQARGIVDLLSVSGGPVTHEVLARAMVPAPHVELAQRIASLRFAHLIQTGGSRAADRVDVYHDRVRATVLARLDASQRRALHHKLARAFEQGSSMDAEALATHWLGAGEADRAAGYARLAGDRAAEALAFERAAHFYELALSLRAHADADARELHAKLGEALANVGLASRAAIAFQRAAEGAPVATALDLRRRAAEQLLRGGYFDEGLTAIRTVLASIGMRVPATPLVGFLQLLLWRLVLRVRGVRFRERDQTQIALRDLTRIDVCSSAALGLGLIDTIRAAALQSRHILLALRAGEPMRVARALAFESINLATGGRATWRRTQALTARAGALAERTGRPEVIALATFSAGFVHYMNGKFRRAFELLDRSHRMMRTECQGMSFEMVTAQWAMLNCLMYLGELGELRARRPQYLREAAARGDLYGVVNLSLGPGNWSWLVDDRVDEARAELADAMRRWSKQGFHVEHFNALFARVGIELYAGRGADAFSLVTQQWGAIRWSFLLSIQILRISARIARGFAALSALSAIDGQPERRAALVAIAKRDARGLERERVGWASAEASVLRAGSALVENGDAERARRHLEVAAATFDANDMPLHAAAVRRRLGQLVGGDAGAALSAGATAWMVERGIRDPERMTALVAPGPARAKRSGA